MSLDRLKELINSSTYLVVFTGAGISSESGIPTYRGDDGVWHKYDPEKYANISYFLKDPSYYWNFFKDVRYPVLKKAKPNKAHICLASLEEKGLLKTVITQNIDGLHQMAGSKNVLELHGNTRTIYCTTCKQTYSIEEIYKKVEKDQIPPKCQCGGILRPDVVFFGESLPFEVLEKAREESLKADLFMVIGSSLVVQPAASLPLLAKENHAKLVIINKDATPLDSMADLVFHERATVVLGSLKL